MLRRAGGGALAKPIRIAVVDDHPVFREGLVHLLTREPDVVVALQAETPLEAMRGLRNQTVDLCLVDITLADANGLQLVHQVHAEWPHIGLLVLSMHDEALYAERALLAGASGYVMKDRPWTDVHDAIRAVARGQTAFSASITGSLLRGSSLRRDGTDALSDRELEVFELLGLGRRVREVADALGISPKTVESHVASIKRKLSIGHVNELVHRATLWSASRALGGSAREV